MPQPVSTLLAQRDRRGVRTRFRHPTRKTA